MYPSLQSDGKFLSFSGTLSPGWEQFSTLLMGELCSGGELCIPTPPLLFPSMPTVELRWADSAWVRTGARVEWHWQQGGPHYYRSGQVLGGRDELQPLLYQIQTTQELPDSL